MVELEDANWYFRGSSGGNLHNNDNGMRRGNSVRLFLNFLLWTTSYYNNNKVYRIAST